MYLNHLYQMKVAKLDQTNFITDVKEIMTLFLYVTEIISRPIQHLI